MSDPWAVALAAAVWAAAVAAVDGHVPAPPLALPAGALAALLAAGAWPPAADRARRAAPAVLCLAGALASAALAHRSLAGLAAPLASGPVRAEVVLVGDPEPDGGGGVTALVRHEGRRLRATARGAAAAALDDRLTGERVAVVGEVTGPSAADRWARHRHVAGRLRVDTVLGWRAGDPATRVANALRRTLARGASGLPARQRSLLAGVTLGDDRHQPPDLADAFAAAGLTHLLAVSGQNVAFVLVVAGPVLARLRFGPRLGATLAVLAMFALVTRAEPSVLRATAMAAVAAVGTALGRPASSARTLALGVAAMVLVDPLLVTSLGFQLSVAGAGGIVAGATRLERALPGPRWLTAPLAVTVAAQAAVSPLLVHAFGSVPLASLPCNLLAGPVSGPLMVWGLTGGLAAGLAGGPVASVLHLPTRALLWWLEAVATAGARWPLGELRSGHLVALALAGGAVVAGGRARPRPGPGAAAVRAGGALAAAATVAVAALAVPRPGRVEGEPLGPGAELWVDGGAAVVLVDGRSRAGAVLAGLRARGVRRVDAVVVRTGAAAARGTAATLRRRWPGAVVLVPPAGRGARPTADGLDAVSPPRGAVVAVGGLRLTVAEAAPDRLAVVVTAGPPPAPAGCAGGACGPPILGARAAPPTAAAAPRRRALAGRRAGRSGHAGARRRRRPVATVRPGGRGGGRRRGDAGGGGRPRRRPAAAAPRRSGGARRGGAGGGAGRDGGRGAGGWSRRRGRRPRAGRAGRRRARRHRGAGRPVPGDGRRRRRPGRAGRRARCRHGARGAAGLRRHAVGGRRGRRPRVGRGPGGVPAAPHDGRPAQPPDRRRHDGAAGGPPTGGVGSRRPAGGGWGVTRVRLNAPVYLVKGDDDVLLRDAARSLVHELTGDLDPNLAVEEVGRDRLSPPDGEASIVPLVDAAQTPPFLTERRVVVGRDLEMFTRQAQVAPLVDYLADPLPTTSLVLVWSGGRVPKPLLDAIRAAKGEVVDTGPGRNKVDDWVKEQLAAAGLTLDAGARKAVVAWLGDDPQRLVGLVETLVGTYGAGARLTAADVEPHLGEAGGVPPWHLTDAIDEGRINVALEMLGRMMAGGGRHALAVLATLHTHFARLLLLDGAPVSGERDAAQLLGVHPKAARRLLAQARKLGHARIVRALDLLAAADIDLRGGKAWPSELVMEVLVARLAQLAR
ncbi:MAG: DNA polymerase III subunit delta [Thermoanaerobacterales bacterium]